MPPSSAVLTGEIYFDPDAGAPRTGVLHIILEDVGQADRPSKEMAKLTLNAVWPQGGEDPLPFSMPLPVLDPGGQYGLRVHADVSGGGRITALDQITVESIPISPFDPAPRIQAHLRLIT